MNPPEYHTVANELLPRFMFKLSKFVIFDNEILQQLNSQLDEIDTYATIEEKKQLSTKFTDTITATITDFINKSHINISKPQKSIMTIINEHNPNIRMPTNAINMLFDYICSFLMVQKNLSDIVTSASEPIVCNKEVFTLITDLVYTWLQSNKAHYVIL